MGWGPRLDRHINISRTAGAGKYSGSRDQTVVELRTCWPAITQILRRISVGTVVRCHNGATTMPPKRPLVPSVSSVFVAIVSLLPLDRFVIDEIARGHGSGNAGCKHRLRGRYMALHWVGVSRGQRDQNRALQGCDCRPDFVRVVQRLAAPCALWLRS